MYWIRVIRILFLVLAVTLCLPAGKSESGRRPSIHDDVWLRNEAGERITPSDNAADPYSPKKTCGTCHHYPTITQGDHFKMGSSEQKSVLTFIPNDMRPVPYTGTAIYDWIAVNALYHPGGGLMEKVSLGRLGGTSPEVDLMEAEQKVSSGRNPHFQSGFTPDSKSHFRASGVLEADCLMCHMSSYRLDRRNDQVAARNYRWAATAGAGFGEVKGRIWKDGVGGRSWDFSTRPSVQYQWRSSLFSAEGKISGRVIGKTVASSACLQCHRATQAFRTGTLYLPDRDVHVKAGFTCTSCHGLAAGMKGGRLSHFIGRKSEDGNPRNSGMKTCGDCHLKGASCPEVPAKAPNPEYVHAKKFENATFHLRLFACTACHVTSLPAKGTYLLDDSIGKASWYTADRFELIRSINDAVQKAHEPWRPWQAVLDLKGSLGERYVPVALHTAQWFGERGLKERILPIDREVVSNAFRQCTGITTVQVRDTTGRLVRQPTVATVSDIGRMLKALNGLGRSRSVFVSDKVYELRGGKVVSMERPSLNTVTLPIWHNVNPVAEKQTYGAKGCTDCHGEKANFFTRMKVRNVGRFLKDDYPNMKGPNAYPQMQDWGYEEVPSHE